MKYEYKKYKRTQVFGTYYRRFPQVRMLKIFFPVVDHIVFISEVGF